MLKSIVFLALVILVTSNHLQYEHERTYSSSKKSSPVVAFLVGILLIVVALPMIWYNQRKASIDDKHLREAQSRCQSFNPNQNIPSGQLVHLSGQAVSHDILRDHGTGTQIRGALKLKIDVEVKEWRKNGRDDDSPIVLEWTDCNERDIDYDHHNDPASWFLVPETVYSTNAHLGKYILCAEQIDECSNYVPILLSQSIIQNVKSRNPVLYSKHCVISGDFAYFSSSPDIQAHGTLRVKARYIPAGPLSVICAKSPNGPYLTPYPLFNQDNENPCLLSQIVNRWFAPMAGINLVKQEIIDKDQLVNHALEWNTLKTNILRLVCFLLLVFGFLLLFSPISTLLGYIPFVGGFLKLGSGLLFFIASILLAIPIFVILMSIAWLYYNPRIGIIILSIGIIILAALLIYNYKTSHSIPHVVPYNVPRPVMYY